MTKASSYRKYLLQSWWSVASDPRIYRGRDQACSKYTLKQVRYGMQATNCMTLSPSNIPLSDRAVEIIEPDIPVRCEYRVETTMREMFPRTSCSCLITMPDDRISGARRRKWLRYMTTLYTSVFNVKCDISAWWGYARIPGVLGPTMLSRHL